MKPIGHIYTGFSQKFGVPRQSRLADTKGRIVLEGEYASADAVRGLEEFSHIWIIWQFSEAVEKGWSPTVRPPRLGGNVRKGVFATRSPFRPNHLGLSCVKLDRVEVTGGGPVLHVTGADLTDGTPVYDIKPYVPYADCVPEARGGFAQDEPAKLEVSFAPGCGAENFDEKRLRLIRQLLAQDPRPPYQDDPERIYGMDYDGMAIRFKVLSDRAEVVEIR